MNRPPPGYYPYQNVWPNTAYPYHAQAPMPPQAPGNPYATPPGAYMNTAQMPGSTPHSGSTLTNPRFIRGALIGAVAAYLLTNENVQQAVIKSAVKTWSLVQGSVEEMKERFRDAEAELHAAQAPDME